MAQPTLRTPSVTVFTPNTAKAQSCQPAGGICWGYWELIGIDSHPSVTASVTVSTPNTPNPASPQAAFVGATGS